MASEPKSKIPEIRPDKFWENWSEGTQKWISETLGIDAYSPFADSDWTLIVKLHAMIEATLNSALVARLGLPELEETIARLDTSNFKTGKVAFAKALQILDNESCTFLQTLSELRNFCVHDIRNFNFDLETYLSSKGVNTRSEAKRKQHAKILDKQVPSEEEYPAQTKLKVGVIMIFEQLHLAHMKSELHSLRSTTNTWKAERYDELRQSSAKIPPIQTLLESLGLQPPQ